MKYFLLIMILLLVQAIEGTLFSQTLVLSDTTTTINAGIGNGLDGDGNSYVYTIGQLSAPTFIRPNQSFEIGFLHCLPCEKWLTNNTDADLTHTIRVFPNPTTSQIVLNSTFNQSLYFRLMDIHGRLCFTGVLLDIHTLDLRSLSEGLYTIIFYDNQGEIISRSKVLKH